MSQQPKVLSLRRCLTLAAKSRLPPVLRVSGSDPDALAKLFTLDALSGVVSLDLTRCALHGSVTHALASSRQLAAVRTLILDECDLENEDAGVLSRAFLPRLRTLSVYRNELDAQGVARIVNAAFCDRLLALNLCGNTLGDPAARVLEKAARLQQLRVLNLAGEAFTALDPISADGARVLARWPGAAHLEELHLGNNGVGADGVAALGSSPQLKRLRRLSLAYNGLETAALAVTVTAPGLRALTHLDLSGNTLKTEGALALAGSPFLPRIAVLTLSECGELSQAAVTALRKRYGRALRFHGHAFFFSGGLR